MLKRTLIGLAVLSATASAFSIANDATAPVNPVTSIEFKVTLQAEPFAGGMGSVDQYRSLVLDLIDGERVVKSYLGDGVDEAKRVSYWDTADHRLRQQGISVRLRDYSDGEREVTVKFRGDSQRAAEDWLFPAAEGLDVGGKTEIDRTPAKEVYSRSLDVDPGDAPVTAANLLAWFPGFADYGLTADSEVSPVNDFSINHEDYVIAKYQFDDRYSNGAKEYKKISERKLELTLWRCDDGSVAVAEASWKVKRLDASDAFVPSAIDEAKAIQDSLKVEADWVHPTPGMKTAMVYNTPEQLCR